MDPQEPQIFDIDPEKAPRMTAIILLACGVLGVGFVLLNTLATGDDPYYIESQWEEGTEPVHQRYDILPNMVRGRQEVGDSDEDEEAQAVPVQRPTRKPTTNSVLNPLNPSTLTPRPAPGTPGAPAVPPTPTTPGTPGTPATPGFGTPPTPGGAAGPTAPRTFPQDAK